MKLQPLLHAWASYSIPNRFIDELNAAGLQTVIDEAQKQLDAFFAE